MHLALRAAAIFLVFIILLVTIWLVAGDWSASRRESKVDQSWEKHLGSMKDVPSHFPKASDNDSAIKLEELTSELGIDLVPKLSSRKKTASGDNRELKEFSKVMQGYLNTRLSQTDHSAPPLPKQIQNYLLRHEARTRKLIEFVRLHQAPQWECDIKKLSHAPFPNLIGIRTLQEIFLTYAFLKNDSGNLSDVNHALQASWKLNESLLKRPEYFSYMFAIGILKMQTGALRQMNGLESEWRQKPNSKSLLQACFYSMQRDDWVLQEELKQARLPIENHHSVNFLLRPVFRAQAAEVLEKRVQSIEDLMKRNPCSPRRELTFDEMDKMFSFWNWIKVGYNDPAPTWNRVARLLIHMEMTGKILEIHRSAGSHDQEFESSVCSGERWAYHMANGIGTLSFSKKIDWEQLEPSYLRQQPPPKGIMLATIHVEHLKTN